MYSVSHASSLSPHLSTSPITDVYSHTQPPCPFHSFPTHILLFPPTSSPPSPSPHTCSTFPSHPPLHISLLSHHPSSPPPTPQSCSLLALSALAIEHNFVRPQLTEEDIIHIQAGRWPTAPPTQAHTHTDSYSGGDTCVVCTTEDGVSQCIGCCVCTS